MLVVENLGQGHDLAVGQDQGVDPGVALGQGGQVVKQAGSPDLDLDPDLDLVPDLDLIPDPDLVPGPAPDQTQVHALGPGHLHDLDQGHDLFPNPDQDLAADPEVDHQPEVEVGPQPEVEVGHQLGQGLLQGHDPDLGQAVQLEVEVQDLEVKGHQQILTVEMKVIKY